MTATIDIGLADVQMLVEEVWTSFLGADEPVLPAIEPGTPGGWSAAVTISGGWEAQCTVWLTEGGARAVTARMLMCDEADVTDDDLRDALGELVNMVGGNVKSLAASTASLSLPLVGHGDLTPASHLDEVVRLDLTWLGDPVRVSVHTPPEGADR